MLIVMKAQRHRRAGAERLREDRSSGPARPLHSRSAAHRHRHHRQRDGARSRHLRRNGGRAGSHPRQQALQAGEPRREGGRHGHPLPWLRRQLSAATKWPSSPGPAPSSRASRRSPLPNASPAPGRKFFRGGAYKPRTSPYAFQGLAEDGLKILAEVRDRFGLLIVTEAVDNESLDLVEKYADIIQIGARNMQNFSLLKRAGRAAQAGAAEARHVGDAGRVPDGRRIHHERGQLQRHPVRARRAHLRRPHPQHARSQRGAGGAAAEPPADHRRSQPRHRQAQQGDAAVARRGGRRRRRPDHRSAPRSRPRAQRRQAVALSRAVRQPDGRGAADCRGAGAHHRRPRRQSRRRAVPARSRRRAGSAAAR